MTCWCSVHPSVFQGSHLLQGWVFAKKEHLHGPVPKEVRSPKKRQPVRLRPRVLQPGVFGRCLRPELPLCRRWGGCRSPLLGFAPVLGGNELKGLGFRGTLHLALITELSTDRRYVVSSGTPELWLGPVSFLLHHCLVFKLESSLHVCNMVRAWAAELCNTRGGV